jgi:hypothetical protein
VQGSRSTSARAALGARPPWRVPVGGPQRVVAIERLRETIATDILAQLDALAVAGWLGVHNDPDTLSIIASVWHNVVAEGVGRALDRLPETCGTCGAEVSQGRCWGCGAPPGRGL